MSANHSTKYFAEVLNIVDCYRNKATMLGKIPIFITATLDGCYHTEVLKGDYSSFDYKRINREIPKHLREKIKQQRPFTITDLRDCLGRQFGKFLNAWSYIDKTTSRDYIRVLEPHKKSGVPHLHALLYVNPSSVDELKKAFIRCFPAPQNHKRTQKNLIGDDINGFQTNIISASGYILKYILKTFREVQKGAKLSLINAWYVKHKIRRFTRSQLKLISTKQRISICVLRRLRLYNISKGLKDFKDVMSELDINGDNAKINYFRDDKQRLFIECLMCGYYIQITPTQRIEYNLYTNREIITQNNFKIERV